MIVKMKFINISGPRNDIDRVTKKCWLFLRNQSGKQ